MALACNVGGSERTARIGLGAGLLAAGLFVPMKKWMKVTADALGVVGLATGLSHYCPISQMAGRNTCSVREQVESEVSALAE